MQCGAVVVVVVRVRGQVREAGEWGWSGQVFHFGQAGGMVVEKGRQPGAGNARVWKERGQAGMYGRQGSVCRQTGKSVKAQQVKSNQTRVRGGSRQVCRSLLLLLLSPCPPDRGREREERERTI